MALGSPEVLGGFRVVLGFRVFKGFRVFWDLGFRVSGLGGVQDLRFRV